MNYLPDVNKKNEAFLEIFHSFNWASIFMWINIFVCCSSSDVDLDFANYLYGIVVFYCGLYWILLKSFDCGGMGWMDGDR